MPRRSSNVSSHAFTLGGRIVRNDIIAVLDGEGVECTLNGLYLADGERLVDNHTTIDHAKPHCASHELYKGILDGRARGVFNGKIIVRTTRRRPTPSRPTGAAAVRRRHDQHQAAARDLRRRREVHARRHDRPARRRRRSSTCGRAGSTYLEARGHADPCLRRRDPRARQDRAAAPGARGRALRPARPAISAEVDAA